MDQSEHLHHHRHISPWRRWGALAVGLLTFGFQFHFARESNSATVWADLGHLFFDLVGTGIATWLFYRTRGLSHAESHQLERVWAKRLLILLILAIAWVLHEGFERLGEAHAVDALTMQRGAWIGLVGNVLQFLIFGGCPCASDHVSRLHIALDMLSSAISLIGSYVYKVTGSVAVDTMGSFAIALVMLTLIILTWLDLHKKPVTESR